MEKHGEGGRSDIRSVFIEVDPSTQYTASLYARGTSGGSCGILIDEYDQNGTYLGVYHRNYLEAQSDWGCCSKTFTTSANCRKVVVSCITYVSEKPFWFDDISLRASTAEFFYNLSDARADQASFGMIKHCGDGRAEIYSEFINVNPSTHYMASYYVKGTSGGTCGILIDEYDETGTWLGIYHQNSVEPQDNWSLYCAKSFTTNANCRKIIIRCTTVHLEKTFWFDDVSLTESSEAW